MLVLIHGVEKGCEVSLPTQDGVSSFELIWNSAFDVPAAEPQSFAPDSKTLVSGTSIQLFRCNI